MKNVRDYIVTAFLFFFVFQNSATGQNLTDTTILKTNKINFSYSIGTQYQTLLHDKYFPLDTSIPGPNSAIDIFSGHVGCTYIPTFGIQTAVLCDIILTKELNIQYGFQLYIRHEKYEMTNDINERSIVNDFNIQHSFPLDTLKSIYKSITFIQIPIYIGYSIKRFNFSIGTHITNLSSDKTQKTSINNYKTTIKNTKDVFDLKLCPSLKIKYLLPINRVYVSSYFAIDKRYWKYYDFQIGFEVKFCSLK